MLMPKDAIRMFLEDEEARAGALLPQEVADSLRGRYQRVANQL